AVVDGGNPVQVRLGDLGRGDLPIGQGGRELRGGHPGEFHQSSPRIRGTLYRCCSTAGASASTASGGRHGTGSSSRNTLVRPVACEVGGMPSAATSWTCATAVIIWSSWGARWSSSASVSAILDSRARYATSSRVMGIHAILGAERRPAENN